MEGIYQMSRPMKQGLDYFPMDVDFDNKTTLFLVENEALGLAVLVSIWQLIYAENGYYIDMKDLPLLIKKRISCGVSDVINVVNSAVNRGIFDGNLYKSYNILTSKAIQKRYFEAARKKKQVKIIADFLLIDINSYGNVVNSGINPVNSAGNPLKKSKVKKRKENKNTFPVNSKNEFPDDVIFLGNFFAKTLPKKLWPKNGQRERWLDTLDKCIRIDGYTKDQLMEIIETFRNDTFWQSNFLTPIKLRKKNPEGVKYIDYFWQKLESITTEGLSPEELKIQQHNKKILAELEADL